ncbi:ribosomal protein S18 acetylase RimI-like enzyme [Paenochrobactrum gallinarii]|uniref:Ribosomal protein S18 acetylase RimI-like enzyme n=1 Tax=Paenochrobactrum gallinarii TaxID=643673 RepID=A0A841LSZ6_9HYPH|nr:GNAT family N-acetyltransferase [Paenochrobactrum gallinarii]MBB6261355.1 ribosomal protein S18 acetylase RimI-like enzyme [Paenochrobactrum gallinarii]
MTEENKTTGADALQARRDRITVRVLCPDDVQTYKAVRIHALKNSPLTFGSSFAVESAYADEVFAHRIRHGGGNAVYGAFDGDTLLGTAGVFVHERLSEKHRGTLWGVYVMPQARGLGLGSVLVDHVIKYAEKHVVVLDAKVVASNDYARQIYYDLGFEKYGLEKKSFCVEGQFQDQELIFIDFSSPEWRSRKN